MKFASRWLLTTLLFIGLASASLVLAQESSQSPAPDNTKVNQGDQNKANATADQQAENKSDRDIAQQIRKSVANDKSLEDHFAKRHSHAARPGPHGRRKACHRRHGG